MKSFNNRLMCNYHIFFIFCHETFANFATYYHTHTQLHSGTHILDFAYAVNDDQEKYERKMKRKSTQRQ